MRASWKPKSAEPRQCEICSVTLERRRNSNGRLEGFRDFLRRRFCSLSCANSRSKGGKSRKAYHYRARKNRLANCECCGTPRRLQVHHINEDWTDNTPGNLQTLCIFCHHFWHAMHIRLGITPTQPMPRLVSLCTTKPDQEWDGCAPTEMRSSRRKPKPSSEHTAKPEGLTNQSFDPSIF